MSILQETNSTAMDVVSSVGNSGHIDSGDTLLAGSGNLWDEAVDTILSWATEDHIDCDCFTSAIDFAIDMQSGGYPAPSCIAGNADGTISFEWRYTNTVLIFEVQSLGEIEHLIFKNGKVIHQEVLNRDPLTRKHELLGM